MGDTVALAMADEPLAEVKDIGDKMAALTSTQARDLREYLKDTYGIESTAGSSAPVDNGGEKKVEVVEEQTSFDVILTAAGDKRVNVIKEIRTITNLGLKEAKELVDKSAEGPQTIKEAAPKEEANKIKAAIEAAGGKVELK